MLLAAIEVVIARRTLGIRNQMEDLPENVKILMGGGTHAVTLLKNMVSRSKI